MEEPLIKQHRSYIAASSTYLQLGNRVVTFLRGYPPRQTPILFAIATDLHIRLIRAKNPDPYPGADLKPNRLRALFIRLIAQLRAVHIG